MMKTNFSTSDFFKSKFLPRNWCIKRWLAFALISGLWLVPTLVFSAGNGAWRIAGQYQLTQPIGSLHNWFGPTPIAASLILQKQTEEHWFWGIKAEMIQYQQANKDKLFYDDLDLSLVCYGLSAQGDYFFRAARHRLEPFMTGSAGIYHWHSSGGGYQLDDIYVPERDQSDWSWGFCVGPGIQAHLTRNLAVAIRCQYQIIIAELWPALALRLENVSGLQMLNGTVGLVWSF